jgi:hypothetical protein
MKMYGEVKGYRASSFGGFTNTSVMSYIFAKIMVSSWELESQEKSDSGERCANPQMKIILIYSSLVRMWVGRRIERMHRREHAMLGVNQTGGTGGQAWTWSIILCIKFIQHPLHKHIECTKILKIFVIIRCNGKWFRIFSTPTFGRLYKSSRDMCAAEPRMRHGLDEEKCRWMPRWCTVTTNSKVLIFIDHS